jgi:hypothetical protein
MSLKTDLDFENKETKELLCRLDFEYFLKEHIAVENYSRDEVDQIYAAFTSATLDLRKRVKDNKKQFLYFLEGQVRKGFTGGFLPAIFHLDRGRHHHFLDFPAVGEN